MGGYVGSTGEQARWRCGDMEVPVKAHGSIIYISGITIESGFTQYMEIEHRDMYRELSP